MAVFDQLTIPDEGVALLTSVIANQGTLTVTEMRFSDIDYTGQEHSITAATWAGTFQTVTPSASVHDTTTINVTGSFTNAGYSSDKTLKTVGIVGEDSNGVPTLIGVAVATSYDVIPQQYITPSTFTYSANIVVSSTADIHVSGSQAGALFVADIIDDLSSQDTDKPLSANQGYVLKGLIDNVQGGGSNRNLLLNPFFTVNQRGVTSGTEGNTDHYLMDQWVGSRCNYSLGTSGLTFAWDGVTQTNGYFKQQIEGDFSAEVGKPLTISAIVDGTLYTNTFTLATSATDMAIVTGLVYSAYSDTTKNNNIIVRLKSTDTTSHTIKAVKLELGSTSTLALDELPPDYTTELLKCQRYLKVYDSGAFFPGFANNSTSARIVVTFPVEMRATPTLTWTSSIRVVFANSGGSDVTALTIGDGVRQSVNLIATTTGLTAGQGVNMKTYSGGQMIFSAEL